MSVRKKRQVARTDADLAVKRGLILDAAKSLLIERGYARTTMSSIGSRAGVGRGTVYWHFESKDDLFVRLLQRELETFDAALRLLMERPLPALDRLELLVESAFQSYGENPGLLTAVLNVLSGTGDEAKDQIMSWASEQYRRYNVIIERLLEAGKDEGTVRRGLDSQIAASAIVVLLDAMYVQIHFGLIRNDPERLTQAVLSLLGGGYRTHLEDA